MFSWNELFNNPAGDQIYLIVEKEGKLLRNMDERFLLICPADFKTGRRMVKGLSRITVGRG